MNVKGEVTIFFFYGNQIQRFKKESEHSEAVGVRTRCKQSAKTRHERVENVFFFFSEVLENGHKIVECCCADSILKQKLSVGKR